VENPHESDRMDDEDTHEGNIWVGLVWAIVGFWGPVGVLFLVYWLLSR